MDQNKMKKIAPIIIAIVAAGGISFYGGMKYQEGKASNLQNLSQEDRQQMFQQTVSGARVARTGTDATGINIPRSGTGMNAASGEVISKDDKSITVKLRDGGSKIFFFSEKTTISKTEEGAQSDVVVGEQVQVSGTANSDGSVTATMIQLRPALPPMPSGSPASSGN